MKYNSILAVLVAAAFGCSSSESTLDASLRHDSGRDVWSGVDAVVDANGGFDVHHSDAKRDGDGAASSDVAAMDAVTSDVARNDSAVDARADAVADALPDVASVDVVRTDGPPDDDVISSDGGDPLGSACRTTDDCAPGLLCCYPCGIDGCMNVCTRPLPGTHRCPLIP
jgi:hypothetical protein